VLSEAGVLGFEYGYSLDWPDALVLWEAQFGDFANAAQVIIDQFIVSAEDKWKRCRLGHALAARLRRAGARAFRAPARALLGFVAEENIQVVQPTRRRSTSTCCRRQVLRPWRKPLVVFTPKSLLRLPQVHEPARGLRERRLPAGDPGTRA
jgi:2-oxoglutarate dehydrogenase E1 component